VREEFKPSAEADDQRRLNWKAILTVRPSMIAHRTSLRRCVYLTFALIRLSTSDAVRLNRRAIIFSGYSVGEEEILWKVVEISPVDAPAQDDRQKMSHW
jgi:hypothetical protein